MMGEVLKMSGLEKELANLRRKRLPTNPKAQDSIEDYDTSQGPSSDDGDNHEGLKSPLARKQNHSSAAGSLRHKLRGMKNQTTSQQSVYSDGRSMRLADSFKQSYTSIVYSHMWISRALVCPNTISID
jgi:hypothetical protein